jgi:predicted fused transcriptional regulator/phosphomethylpyrimidine kinase
MDKSSQRLKDITKNISSTSYGEEFFKILKNEGYALAFVDAFEETENQEKINRTGIKKIFNDVVFINRPVAKVYDSQGV